MSSGRARELGHLLPPLSPRGLVCLLSRLWRGGGRWGPGARDSGAAATGRLGPGRRPRGRPVAARACGLAARGLRTSAPEAEPGRHVLGAARAALRRLPRRPGLAGALCRLWLSPPLRAFPWFLCSVSSFNRLPCARACQGTRGGLGSDLGGAGGTETLSRGQRGSLHDALGARTASPPRHRRGGRGHQGEGGRGLSGVSGGDRTGGQSQEGSRCRGEWGAARSAFSLPALSSISSFPSRDTLSSLSSSLDAELFKLKTCNA